MVDRLKRRVYAVHLFNDFSGSPRVLADALSVLSEAGYDCCAMTSQHNGFLSGLSRRYIVPYLRLGNRWAQLLVYLFSQVYCFGFLLIRLLSDKLGGYRPIVLVNTMLPFGACIAAKLSCAQCIVYVHETSLSPKSLKFFLRAVIERCADKVIFVSRFLSEIESFHRPMKAVIYNGLRRDVEFKCPEDVRRKFNDSIILFCGSPKPYKGIFQFFELASALKDFRFVAALNCDQSELDLLKKDVPPNLCLIARPSNIAVLYEQAFLVINLSDPAQWVETFGLSLLEGMASGCPVIAPHVGGPTEFVDATVGACINPNNLDEICSYIFGLKINYDYWLSCSCAARARAKLFGADVYRRNLLDFFSTLD